MKIPKSAKSLIGALVRAFKKSDEAVNLFAPPCTSYIPLYIWYLYSTSAPPQQNLSSKLFFAQPSNHMLSWYTISNHSAVEQYKTCCIDLKCLEETLNLCISPVWALFKPPESPELLYSLCMAPTLSEHRLAVNLHGYRSQLFVFIFNSDI